MPSQGLFSFPGITKLVQGTVSLAHGITPQSNSLRTAPQTSLPPQVVGSLTVSYGGTTVVLQDCKIDKFDIDIGADGREFHGITILDRRWKWKDTGEISGAYNQHQDETAIKQGTEKSPQELATLCLEAMGESNFDVSQMPNILRPEFNWSYERPARALAAVADAVGCVVVLRLDNSVLVAPVGVGATLPTQNVVSASIAADPPEIPDTLAIVSGPLQWQNNFELEAVGRERDGTVVPIDELSYAPAITGFKWRQGPPVMLMSPVDGQFKAIADESVFLWYRIKTPFTLPAAMSMLDPGDVGDATVNDLDQILPLFDEQIEREEVKDNFGNTLRTAPRKAWVYGEFNRQNANYVRSTVGVEDNTILAPEGIYPHSFTLDVDTGIVKFANPVYVTAVSFGGQLVDFFPADLRLRAVCQLRSSSTNQWHRREKTRQTPPPQLGTLPRYEVREDIIYQAYIDETAELRTTVPEADAAADHYLDAMQAEYMNVSPNSAVYAGFVRIELDGAIKQISWTIDGQGRALTQASRNDERLIRIPTFKERRLVERIQQDIRNKRRENNPRVVRRESKVGRP